MLKVAVFSFINKLFSNFLKNLRCLIPRLIQKVSSHSRNFFSTNLFKELTLSYTKIDSESFKSFKNFFSTNFFKELTLSYTKIDSESFKSFKKFFSTNLFKELALSYTKIARKCFGICALKKFKNTLYMKFLRHLYSIYTYKYIIFNFYKCDK